MEYTLSIFLHGCVLGWIALVVYNLFFSPCRHLPGPLISQLVPVYDNWFLITGTFHSHVARLHSIYGPVVRLGFDKISFNHPDAWKEIHSTYKFRKASFYENLKSKGNAMLTMTDRESHSARRRTVTKAFLESNTLNLEGTFNEIGIGPLLNKIDGAVSKNKSATLDLAQEFLFLTLDVMGNFLFCRNFNFLINNDRSLLQWSQRMLYMSIATVVIPPLKLMGNPYFDKISSLAEKAIRTQREAKVMRKGILEQLLGAKDPETNQPISDIDLKEECVNILVAGSDTTALTLTWTLYALLKNPQTLKKLEDAVCKKFTSPTQEISWTECKSIPYLQAVIKEGMRYYPVASIPLFRVVPDQGASILGWDLPPKTEVFTSTYATHRSAEFWPEPDQFIPERWVEGTSEYKKYNLNIPFTFMPFSTGPSSCPGRHIAYMELSLTLANLIHKYNMEFTELEYELIPVSSLTLEPKGHKPLPVRLSKRRTQTL